MKTTIKSFSPVILAALATIMPASQVSATNTTLVSQLMVKTSVVDVLGVREIESGSFEKGIRRSKAGLAKTSAGSLRKPLLDNLCVAHLAIKDMEQASQYCHAAINAGKTSAISFNNRAVMHYVLGDVEASLDDLDAASKFGSFQNMVGRNLRIVSQQKLTQ